MININNLQRDFVICFFCCVSFFCISTEAHDGQEQIPFSAQKAHAPTPLPDRVTLTWEDDPATSQSVTWRTDTSVQEGQAQLAIANANGRALQPETFEAETTFFKSDINDAYYHSVKFQAQLFRVFGKQRRVKKSTWMSYCIGRRNRGFF